MDFKAQRDSHWCLNAGATDLSITLRGMAIATREEHSLDKHRKVDASSRSQMANIDIPSVHPRRSCIESPRLSRGNAHNAAERFVGDLDVLAEDAPAVGERVVMNVRVLELPAE